MPAQAPFPCTHYLFFPFLVPALTLPLSGRLRPSRPSYPSTLSGSPSTRVMPALRDAVDAKRYLLTGSCRNAITSGSYMSAYFSMRKLQ